MSNLFYLINAWLIGLAIAAPVGPIGILCIRRTLEHGLRGALAVGLGAALADSVYGGIAATGLTAVSHFLLGQVVFIRVLGGCFLLYLAYKESRSKPTKKEAGVKKNKGALTLQVFFLTLTNPMTILSFIGIFASIGGGAATSLGALIMVLGVFLGSMTWWVILGSFIVKVKHKLPEVWIQRIRYLSVIILAGFGVVAILSAL